MRMSRTCPSQIVDFAGAAGSRSQCVLAGGGGERRAVCLTVPLHQSAATSRVLWLGACSTQAAEFRGLGVKSHHYPALPPSLLSKCASWASNTSLQITAVCTGSYLLRFPVTQSASLTVTFKQAEEEPTTCSAAPSATPASTLLAPHIQSQPAVRPESHTYRRAGVPAGSAGPSSSSSTSPSSPCASMVRAVLSRAWSAPAHGRTDSRTDSRTDPPGTRRAASWTSPAPALSPRAAVALISCLGAGFGQHSGKEAGAKPRSLQSRQGSN